MSLSIRWAGAQGKQRARRGALTAFPAISRPQSLDIVFGALIGVAAFILALTHPWSHALVGEAQFGDAAYWDMGAESWARGYIFSKTPDIRPGYSLIMGMVYALFGVDITRALAAQAFLYAVSTVMLYVMGRHLGGRLIGMVAAVQFALNPYMWEWSAITTTDLVGGFVNLCGLFFLVDALRGRGRIVSGALFGVCFAFANIIRIFTLPFLGPALLLPFLVRAPWRRRLLLSVVIFVATMLAMVPGVLYQYVTTGDPGLSSNSASAIYAASSPKWRIWNPEMYVEVNPRLEARGIPPTPGNVEAEFRRMAIENYIAYPWFQIERLGGGFWGYAAFEGQNERPDRYTFFRPYVLLAPIVVAVLLVLGGLLGLRRRPAGPVGIGVSLVGAVLGAVIVGLLYRFPLPTLLGAQLFGAAGAVVAPLRRRGSREIGALTVAAFWSVTGLLAIFSAGLTGFFLHRLSVQVEPARTLLFALAVLYVIAFLVPNRLERARLLQLRAVVRWMPRLPGLVRPALAALAAAVVLVVVAGGVRLAYVNLVPGDTVAFVRPSSEQMSQLAKELGLSEPIRYVDEQAFPATRPPLESKDIPAEIAAYALPGQFTRFIWNIEDQERTAFWYVLADHARPPALDRTLILGEALGRLTVAEYRDRSGLLLVAPTSGYQTSRGDVSQFSLIAARAFIPWDSGTRSFRLDQIVRFPLGIRLQGEERFRAASKRGKVEEQGLVRVKTGDKNLPALVFETTSNVDGGVDGDKEASVTYPRLWLPQPGRFTAWISVHPSRFAHADIGKPRVEVWVRANDRDVVVGERVLDPMNADERQYLPVDFDLSPFAGQRIDLTIRVLSSAPATAPAVVVVGEPRIVIP
jgi:4-amino-4-deoxy-L-arabinose transferase-like glycosyltransferase